MTADELKIVLSTPAALFVLMLLASFSSSVKQIVSARRAGVTVTCAEYWAHWPETAAALIANVIGFALLILTDQLNFASALGIGYGANSVVDLLRAGGRSNSLILPSEK